MQLVASLWPDKGSNKESVTCCVGVIVGPRRVPLPGQGCGEWQAISHKMSGPSIETCGVPQTFGNSTKDQGHCSSLGAYRGKDGTKAGIRGTMDHSLADMLKQLGVSAFNRRGRLPLNAWQSIVYVPPLDRKGGFLQGAGPTIMWWLLPPIS